MWLRDPLPIEVSRVANVPIGGQFWDEVANGPMDISGWEFSVSVAVSDGQPIILNIPVTVTSPSLGMIDFNINGYAFSIIDGEMDSVSLSYQIKATDFAGNSIIVVRGPLILTPGI